MKLSAITQLQRAKNVPFSFYLRTKIDSLRVLSNEGNITKSNCEYHNIYLLRKNCVLLPQADVVYDLISASTLG